MRRAGGIGIQAAVAGALAGALVVGAAALAPGCASYSTYPGLEGDTAVNDPNAPPNPDLMVKGLRYVLDRHPIEGAYAVNLPPDLKPQKAEWIVAQLEDADARLLTQDAAGLPTYHVSRIWVRGVKAEVDVHRPLVDVPGPSGEPAQQMITVKLETGLRGWRPISGKAWAVGTSDPPAPRYETAQAEAGG